MKKRTADSISAGPGGLVLKAGSVSDTVFTTSTATDAVVKNTSRVDTLTLLNGLVGANSVLAVAHTTADATNITSTDHGSKFDGLVVNGNPVAPDVAPNTDLVLPGIGHVRLREVTRSGNGTGRGRIDVNMIHVVVDKTNPFLPIGSDIIVAHAASAFSRTATQPASISGSAWAATANSNIGNLLQNEIGKAAVVNIGCNGTNGNTNTDSTDGIAVKPVITTGAGTTTAFGNPTSTNADAKTTATVNSVRLLKGIISAGSITAATEETFNGSVRTRSTAGSGFTGAKVLGVPVNVHPNLNVTLLGIGYVILDEEIVPPETSNKPTQVNGIHIFITQSNPLGLPVGSEIIVAHAQAHAGKV